MTAFEAVDSHTEGMPTRVITGGVDPIPGATMLERKLHFEAEMDDLRLLLMREPRGHSAMSGAILQPPTRDDADWGVLFIEVSGLPADVRARDDRRRDRAGGDRHGRGDASRRPSCGSTRRPGSSRRAWRSQDGRAPRGDAAQRAVVPATSATRRRRRASVLRHRVRRQLLRARAGRRRHRVDPARADEYIARGAEIMAAINEPTRRCIPRTRASPAAATWSSTRPAATARTRATRPSIHPGWLDRSPCGTGTSARMAQLHARGELALGEPFVNESVIGTRFTGRLVEETHGRRPAGRRAGDHRPRVGHRARPSTCSTPTTRSPPASRCERTATSSSSAPGSSAPARARTSSRAPARASTVLERGNGWGEGCSWGNAGLLVPSHARPIAAPESLRAGLGWMLRRDSPFGLRPQPALAPWLARYVRASTRGARAAGEGCSAS